MIDIREYEKLKNNILYRNSGKSIKAIMIASSVSNEGCSTVALNLAKTFAKNESLKILLVDGNLRDPVLHKYFELEKDKGFSDLLLGQASINDILKKTTIPNLSLVTSGQDTEDPDRIFELQKLERIMKSLKERADYLVFDFPPVNVFADANIFAPHMDGVVLVIRAGKTRWEIVQNAKRHLQMVRANILGVVLNRRENVIPSVIYKRM